MSHIVTEVKTVRKSVPYGIVTDMKSLVVRRCVTGFVFFSVDFSCCRMRMRRSRMTIHSVYVNKFSSTQEASLQFRAPFAWLAS